MDSKSGKSVWEEIPEEWQSSEQPENPVVSEEKEAYEEEEKKEIPSAEVSQISQQEVPMAQPDRKKKEKSIQKKQKKLDKKKYLEFEKKRKEGQQNSAEHVKNAYQTEAKENKQDFTIMGIVLIVVVIAIVIFVFAFTKTSTQRVYDLIDQRNYSIAYQEIQELYEADKNVDSLVYEFALQCVDDSEYKRAVASLEFLSSDEEKDMQFFDDLLNTMISHGKKNRAEEVLQYMQSHGDMLEQYAQKLYEKYMKGF